jgi:hypothetical protein
MRHRSNHRKFTHEREGEWEAARRRRHDEYCKRAHEFLKQRLVAAIPAIRYEIFKYTRTHINIHTGRRSSRTFFSPSEACMSMRDAHSRRSMCNFVLALHMNAL